MEIELDRGGRAALHVQIARKIRQSIVQGSLPEGTRLPPTRSLARSLGVNRSTVVRAYDALWSEGLIDGQVGRGTVVRPPTSSRGASISPPWESLFARGREADDPEIRELVGLLQPRDAISFAGGLPSPELFPMKELAAVAEEVWRREGESLLHWCPARGYAPLRAGVAERFPGLPESDVMILTGSSQGIFLVARAFLEPGDFVALASPTYLGAIQAFRAAGARLLPVPVEKDGLDVRLLEGFVARTPPKFIYTIPSYQNPTGATMSIEKRRALLDLAGRFGVPIVEDDPYGPLHYDGEAPPSLKRLDANGHVLHIGSFSKILAPGLRVGYLAAPRRVIERLVPSKHVLDLITSPFAQAVVHEFRRRGLLDAHLRRIRTEYGRRRDAMVEALRRLAPSLAFDVPEGGYFVWCRLPRGIGGRELLREGLRERVAFIPGEIFSLAGGGRDRIRLSFVSHSPRAIEEGIGRLAVALRRLRRRGQKKPPAGETAPGPIV